MYNHYIPQSDGSYRRSAAQDHRSRPEPPKPRPEPPKPQPPQECRPEPPRPLPPAPCPPVPPPKQSGILDFLKGLLPRSIDTADLMIVFLLLLMNKDDEGGLSPVLTLALYFLL